VVRVFDERFRFKTLAATVYREMLYPLLLVKEFKKVPKSHSG